MRAQPPASAEKRDDVLQRTPVRFKSSDGTVLAGDLYLDPARSAPGLLLVHRHGGDRSEWQPLIGRLASAKRRYSVLTFDVRGQGESSAGKPDSGTSGIDALKADLLAALAELSAQSKAKSVVLVGSSLGATLVSLVAFREAKVTALALISPGAAIEGADLYRPYSEVRNLPTFIAAAEDDMVSKEPLGALRKMALAGSVRSYPGAVHSAGFLGVAHPEFWQDLESWLMTVHDEAPQERRSLYYAEGKAPKRPPADSVTAVRFRRPPEQVKRVGGPER